MGLFDEVNSLFGYIGKTEAVKQKTEAEKQLDEALKAKAAAELSKLQMVDYDNTPGDEYAELKKATNAEVAKKAAVEKLKTLADEFNTYAILDDETEDNPYMKVKEKPKGVASAPPPPPPQKHSDIDKKPNKWANYGPVVGVEEQVKAKLAAEAAFQKLAMQKHETAAQLDPTAGQIGSLVETIKKGGSGLATEAATVYVHTMDGKTTPVVIKPGSNLQIKTKDGYVCAVISVDPKPPSKHQAEQAVPGGRVVEV